MAVGAVGDARLAARAAAAAGQVVGGDAWRDFFTPPDREQYTDGLKNHRESIDRSNSSINVACERVWVI